LEARHSPNEPGKLAALDTKAANKKIATNRNVNASSASVKSKAAAANRAAVVSKADDKLGCLGLTGSGRRFPPLLIFAHVRHD